MSLADNHLGSDVVNLNYITATFADKNVGNGKGVSVAGISVSGPDAGNYHLLNTTASTAANISPASLTVTANAGQTKVYGAAVPTLTYGLGGFSAGMPSVVSGAPALLRSRVLPATSPAMLIRLPSARAHSGLSTTPLSPWAGPGRHAGPAHHHGRQRE